MKTIIAILASCLTTMAFPQTEARFNAVGEITYRSAGSFYSVSFKDAHEKLVVYSLELSPTRECITFSSAQLKVRRYFVYPTEFPNGTSGYPDAFEIKDNLWHQIVPPINIGEIPAEYKAELRKARKLVKSYWPHLPISQS